MHTPRALPPALLAMQPDVAAQAFPPSQRQRLDALVSAPATIATDLTDPATRDLLAETEILITSWGCPKIDQDILTVAPRLRAVFHAAGSVKEAGFPAELWQRGIVVSSAASANVRPVVQYTLAVILLAGKRSFGLARSYAAGDFRSYPASPDTGNNGRAVGIIGASRIGAAVIRELRTHGFEILVADPTLSPAAAAELGAAPMALDELLRRADVVSVHAPELPQTRGLLGDAQLGLMRDGAILINTARGSLVDTEALTRHCAGFAGRDGRIDAVLDVTDPEPLPPEHPLFALPNVFITPHLAGALGREVGLLGRFTIDEIGRWLRGEPLLGAVTAADLPLIA